MPKKKYLVKLGPEERESLDQLFTSGQASVRKLARARILLKADEGWKDEQIVQALDVGRATVERTRKRFVLEGFDIALNGRPRQRTYDRKLDGKTEAHLIALACSEPPEGHARWTLRLYRTHNEARTDLFHYIEGFYNPRRRHSSLDYLSPANYERRYYQRYGFA